MRFAFISSKTGHYPVAWMCRRLRVSRSGYYAWQRREPSARARRDLYLTLRIRALFEEFDGTYGSPRLHDELIAQGESVSRKRVIRIMQHEGLCAHVPKKIRRTTDSNHDRPVADNTVNRNFNPAGPNQLWAADLSYIRTWQGWVYLAVVLDLYSRRVVGWATADHMRTELPLAALHMAIDRRQPPAGLVHHSDRGSQGGFKWSSQHLDGEVPRCKTRSDENQTARAAHECTRLGGHQLRGGKTNSSFGRRLQQGSRVRTRL